MWIPLNQLRLLTLLCEIKIFVLCTSTGSVTQSVIMIQISAEYIGLRY